MCDPPLESVVGNPTFEKHGLKSESGVYWKRRTVSFRSTARCWRGGTARTGGSATATASVQRQAAIVRTSVGFFSRVVDAAFGLFWTIERVVEKAT